MATRESPPTRHITPIYGQLSPEGVSVLDLSRCLAWRLRDRHARPMEEESNSYAAPKSDLTRPDSRMLAVLDGESVGLLRTGSFPLVCAKCGGKRSVLCHPMTFGDVRPSGFVLSPLLVAAAFNWLSARAAIMVGPPVAFAGLFIATKWARYALPLCPGCLHRWRFWSLASGLAITLVAVWPGVAVMLWPSAIDARYVWRMLRDGARYQFLLYTIRANLLLAAGLGFFVLQGLITYGPVRRFCLPARKIREDRIWVRNLHPVAVMAYLETPSRD